MQTKDVQGRLWSAAPADWVRYIEPTFIPMYQAVLGKLQLNEETMLLDAGCGSGLFMNMARRTGATVTGIDAAPGLLDVARKRLPETTLLIEDLEALPFGEETFDVVTGFNSFQYAGSFENALSEAARVAKRSGKLVIGIWGKEADCESSPLLKAVVSLLPPPPPGTPGPFALSEEGKVEAICNNVGLKVIYKQEVLCPWQFIGLDELHDAFLCTAPCVKAVHAVGEAKVKQALSEAARPFDLADHIYYMRNYFTFFILERTH
ncbi:MAG TPA: class I SAM-dependent methyltransferase [Chitinophagaceae bacterium]|nr:class I SAM-dependent methyltransferase [Chitinophagaceae bacterium]